MNKYIFGMAIDFLAVVGLASCYRGGQVSPTTSSDASAPASSPSIDPKKSFTADEVLRIVDQTRAKDFTGFDLTQYKYQFNKSTQTVLSDERNTFQYRAYSNGFEAQKKIETGEGTFDEFHPTATISGTLSAFPLNEEGYYGYGFVAKEGGHAQDFYQELESNRWVNASTHFDIVLDEITDGMAQGTTGEGFWAAEAGYTSDVFTDVIDGNYVFSITSTATSTEEEIANGYADEENSVSYTISPSLELLSYTYHTKIYNQRKDSGINAETVIRFSNFQFGGRVEKGDIAKITDISNIAKDSLTLAPKKLIIQDGDTPSDQVLELFKNLPAYAKGTKAAHKEYQATSYDDPSEKSVVEDSTAYLDDITIAKKEIADGASQSKTAAEDQIVGREKRIEVAHKNGTSLIYEAPIDPLVLGFSKQSLFNPSGYYANSNHLYFNEAKAFGEVKSDLSTTTRTLVSATKKNGLLSVEWTLDSVYTLQGVPETHLKFKLEIRDDFLSQLTVIDTTGGKETIKETHAMTQGDLQAYSGELFPYQEPQIEAGM